MKVGLFEIVTERLKLKKDDTAVTVELLCLDGRLHSTGKRAPNIHVIINNA